MARLFVADVDVSVVFGHQIHVVEDEAVESASFGRLGESDVHQHAAIKSFITRLQEMKIIQSK